MFEKGQIVSSKTTGKQYVVKDIKWDGCWKVLVKPLDAQISPFLMRFDNLSLLEDLLDEQIL